MQVVIVAETPAAVAPIRDLVGEVGGCRSRCFDEPAAGLAWCLEHDPDLVIVDGLKTAAAIDFVRHLRRAPNRRKVPVLMVTSRQETRVQALEYGVIDFVAEPPERIEFLARARNMLAIRHSHLLLSDRAAMLAEEVSKATSEIYSRERETIMRLARAAEFRDPDTGAHIQRMANYSSLIAANLDWEEERQEMMLQAAPMHDVGKLGTPDDILLKPARLTPEEFEIMKKHAAIGWEILKDSSSPILQMAADIALSHHERFDGSGYPRGLSGEAIPMAGRIVAVADVFDALTSERPYKQPWPIARAVEYLEQGRGSHFDPRCVDAFTRDWAAVLAIRSRYLDEG
ncbi:cyclic di-GMP phosphodiesterase response regulator RpfG [mine drainage metagenome]|uniref:Cyclic di-GMP phosphodiesterase response regulator RpfG n=1 Tax=mine drainage metagenome TaxID=410659 RepID=A0A1J5SER1_9ZZZZ